MAKTKPLPSGKPVSPALHGLLDYGIAAGNLVLPSLLGMSGRARAVFGAFGVQVAVVNALTAQPYAVQRLIPLRVHRRVDLAGAPAYVAVPLLTGAVRERRARVYWFATTAALLALYVLTDWDADPARR
jgi:hypothetical protein